MNNLEKARNAIRTSEELLEDDEIFVDDSSVQAWTARAQAYAAIAQAEHLERIADALEAANKIALLGTPRYRNAEDFIRNIDDEIGGYT